MTITIPIATPMGTICLTPEKNKEGSRGGYTSRLTNNLVSVDNSANTCIRSPASVDGAKTVIKELTAALAKRSKSTALVQADFAGKRRTIFQIEIDEMKSQYLAQAPERERKEKQEDDRVDRIIKKEAEQIELQKKLKEIKEAEALRMRPNTPLDSKGIPVPPPPPPAMAVSEKTTFNNIPEIKNKIMLNQENAKSKAMIHELTRTLSTRKKADWDPHKEKKENRRVAAAIAEEVLKESLRKAQEVARIKPINVVIKLDNNGIPVPPPPQR